MDLVSSLALECEREWSFAWSLQSLVLHLDVSWIRERTCSFCVNHVQIKHTYTVVQYRDVDTLEPVVMLLFLDTP